MKGSLIMSNRGEVYFALYGDEFDPNEITHLVGVQPSSTQRRGSPGPSPPGAPRPSKWTSWKLSTGKIERDIIDVREMSSAVVSQLRDCAAKIASVKERLGLEAVLEVVLYFSTDESVPTPIIGFDHDVIAFLNVVGATIDVDSYK
jgi:hypothetical protein